MSNTTNVQLMIGDVAAALFTDAQIQSFLTISASGGTENVYKAAALACRSLSASAVLLHKAEKIGNYSLDRKSMAKAYLDLADRFDAMANNIPAVDVIQYAHTDAIARQIVINDAMRS